MKFSIIIPVYNVEQYLEKCLLSVVGQNYHDYEIIIVIDGATDGSQEIAENIKKRYPEKNIQIICQEKQRFRWSKKYRNAIREWRLLAFCR